MAQIQLPPQLQKLWTATGYPNATTGPQIVARGSIVNFKYIGQRPGRRISDPEPLVLVADIFTDAIRGVNLNALTFPYVRNLILSYLGKPFSYAFIKNDNYIVRDVKAFRTYKRAGITGLRMLDTKFLIGLAMVARSLDQFEIAQMEAQIQMILEMANKQPVAGPGVVEF